MSLPMHLREDEGIMTNTMTSPPRIQLVRPLDDRVIAGVASGLAQRLDVGAGLLRILFVVSALFGGIGIVLYVVGWLAIRDEGAETSIAEQWIGSLEGSASWVGVGLIVLAAVVILGSTNFIRTEFALAAGLFLAGVLLYRGKLGSSRANETPEPHTDPGATVAASLAPTTAVTTETSEDVPTDAADGDDGGAAAPPAKETVQLPPPPPPPPPPPRPRSYLGRIVVASGLIVIGGVALLDNLDVIDPGFRHYVAAGVFVLGVGLLVGTFFGRARGLIAVGLLAMPLLIVTAAIRVPLSGEYGDRSYEPATAAEVRTNYELSGGQLRLDLRQIDDFSTVQPINVDLGVGELLVWVPEGIDVEIDADVGIGALSIFGEETGGFGVDDRVIRTGGDGVTDLALELEVGIGNLEVIGTP